MIKEFATGLILFAGAAMSTMDTPRRYITNRLGITPSDIASTSINYTVVKQKQVKLEPIKLEGTNSAPIFLSFHDAQKQHLINNQTRVGNTISVTNAEIAKSLDLVKGTYKVSSIQEVYTLK